MSNLCAHFCILYFHVGKNNVNENEARNRKCIPTEKNNIKRGEKNVTVHLFPYLFMFFLTRL